MKYEGIEPRSLIQSCFEEKSAKAKLAIIEKISDWFKEVKPGINRVTFLIPPFDEDKDKTDKEKTVKHLVKYSTHNNTSTMTVYRPRFQAYCLGSCYDTFP
ncbi:hypothetical protein NW752_008729 [Fusarium irregulare]|uniref:Uncharacterized protein n=1 Tax=Fusarium irregulare TaxID=2494466 RepID=A0A9W8PX62_9HYPO|nr:hypothetical protein NW752_008729 [Fusarium irregulare]KAJ4020665.1 hypothetical protein NW766_002154 [Fusarium irregulare]